jgi:hypothetical protein
MPRERGEAEYEEVVFKRKEKKRGLLSECYFPNLRARSRHQYPRAPFIPIRDALLTP